MKSKSIIICFIFTLFLGCGSIKAIKEEKNLAISVKYKTGFNTAWVYTKKILKENGIEIKEENKQNGSIFGEVTGIGGGYIGVWITATGENEVDVKFHSKKYGATQVINVFSPDEFHKNFQLYIDTE